MSTKVRPWRIHCCPLDKDCRKYGAPPRIYFHSPFGSLYIDSPLSREWRWDGDEPMAKRWGWNRRIVGWISNDR